MTEIASQDVYLNVENDGTHIRAAWHILPKEGPFCDETRVFTSKACDTSAEAIKLADAWLTLNSDRYHDGMDCPESEEF